MRLLAVNNKSNKTIYLKQFFIVLSHIRLKKQHSNLIYCDVFVIYCKVISCNTYVTLVL